MLPGTDLLLFGFMLLTGAAALGLLGVLRLAQGKPLVAARLRRTGIDPRVVRVGALAVAVGVVVLVVTRWPVAGLAAAGVTVLWPRIFGGARAGRREPEKIEAIAAWTESLRDTASAAAGLEQAIPATLAAAPPLLEAALRNLAGRLDGRVPLPEALARFADDVADPAADLVVAALTLNARQRAGGLDRILTSLAQSSRDELEMRRKIELERRGLRRQAQRIAGAVTGFAALQALFARGWVAPYSTAAGQLVLAALVALFLAAFVRMRSLSRSETQPRFLTGADAVTEIASYKPRPVPGMELPMMVAFMLVAGCLAVAVLHAYRLAVPPRGDLAGGVQRWDTARSRASRVQRIGGPEANTPGARLARWVAEVITARYRHLSGLNQDLAVTGTTLEAHLSRMLGLAAVGFLGPVAILTMLRTAGLVLPVFVVPLAGLTLGAVMVLVVHRELTETARKRRAEFRRTLSIYLDLVAMSMQAGRGYAEALPAAAEIGTGWSFTELRDAIDGARFSGRTPWTALGHLGERFGISELVDLDGALRLANEDGAKVRATLVARAGTLRAQRIADAEADANQATESMKFALIVMVFAFLSYELYPSIARLFAG